MAIQKPSIPKGTRDFTPDEMVRRNYIFDTIRSVFRLFGYLPIETPAMENLSTLMGKYGEEGDKLLFRILNSGEILTEDQKSKIKDQSTREILPLIAEKGLRYDLTVPFARFVVQHQNELSFPFKRYQVQPVWRADRPQKGRYREFFQCDVDVIGSDSLLNEVELVQIIDEVYTRLGIRVLVRLNNRKVLAGIAEAIGVPEKLTDITIALDKLDKMPAEKVTEEMVQRGIPADAVSRLQPLMSATGTVSEKFELLASFLKDSETGSLGLQEMRTVLNHLEGLALVNAVDFDLTLARGLSYYTGTILEVKALEASIGSICGGGRYDNLTGIFGLPGMSGVGISFGADRIYDVMSELQLFPATIQASTRALFINFGPEEAQQCLKWLTSLRKSGVSAELYPDAAKIKKQMEYANRRNVPFVILAGKDEISAGRVTLKNMVTGEQQSVSPDQLATLLS